jgi:hypothetical protein
MPRDETTNTDNQLHGISSVTSPSETELGIAELRLDDENMLKSFDAPILEHSDSADQSMFLRVVQSVFLRERRWRLATCTKSRSFGLNAV